MHTHATHACMAEYEEKGHFYGGGGRRSNGVVSDPQLTDLSQLQEKLSVNKNSKSLSVL